MFNSQNDDRELLHSVLMLGFIVVISITIIVGLLTMIKLDSVAKDQATIRQSIERLEQDLSH